jgi:hypothetical protein
MNKAEIIAELENMVVVRLFGRQPWLADRETCSAVNRKLVQMGLVECVCVEPSTWQSSPLGKELDVDLFEVFMGLTPRGDLDHFRSVVKDIIRAAGLRDELSFASFRHGGFTEGADADITDAELRAAGRHRSARQLPTYAKRTRKQLISVARKRRQERTKAAHLSE